MRNLALRNFRKIFYLAESQGLSKVSVKIVIIASVCLFANDGRQQLIVNVLVIPGVDVIVP